MPIRAVAKAHYISKSLFVLYIYEAKYVPNSADYKFNPNIKTIKYFQWNKNVPQRSTIHFAPALSQNMPSTWFQNELAVIDWLKGFMNHHKKLSIRCPESTSFSRSTNFNASNV